MKRIDIDKFEKSFVYQGIKYKHGDKVALKVEGYFLTEAMLFFEKTNSGIKVYAFQDHLGGSIPYGAQPAEHGYKHSWILSDHHNEFNPDGNGINVESITPLTPDPINIVGSETGYKLI